MNLSAYCPDPMLQAVARRKVRLFSTIDEGQQRREDAITAAVFGPLAYMPAGHAWVALRSLLNGSLPGPRAWPGPAPDRVDLAFWPRRASADRARFVEPDLFVSISAAGQPVLDLLVEVKWDAPFGEGQLAAQWRSVPEGKRSRTVHVVLVRHLAQAVRGIEFERVEFTDREVEEWDAQRCLLSWHQLARDLWTLSRSTHPHAVRAWAADAAAFLAVVGVVQFVGLGSSAVPETPRDGPLFFRRGRWFGQVWSDAGRLAPGLARFGKMRPKIN